MLENLWKMTLGENFHLQKTLYIDYRAYIIIYVILVTNCESRELEMKILVK